MPVQTEIISIFAEIVISAIAVPWLIWVTASIFNQRQEIAVLKQILSVLMDKK